MFHFITILPKKRPDQLIIRRLRLCAGEPGLLVCEINADSPFSGYARDLQQTEKKKLRDVFRKGDLYFNTGDLLSIDKDGFFYFQDRVGDTFRFARLQFCRCRFVEAPNGQSSEPINVLQVERRECCYSRGV